MSKLSPWFPIAIKPVHVGVYQVGSRIGPLQHGKRFTYWDGRRFHAAGLSPYDAAARYRGKKGGSPFFMSTWRGLAKQTEGAAS